MESLFARLIITKMSKYENKLNGAKENCIFLINRAKMMSKPTIP
jgi:hypothetical protein